MLHQGVFGPQFWRDKGNRLQEFIFSPCLENRVRPKLYFLMLKAVCLFAYGVAYVDSTQTLESEICVQSTRKHLCDSECRCAHMILCS